MAAGDDFEPNNNVNYDAGYSYAFGDSPQYAYKGVKQLGGHVDLDMGNCQDWGITGRARGYEVKHEQPFYSIQVG